MSGIEPVPVHLTGSDVPMGGTPGKVITLKPGYSASFGTVTLTVADPAQPLLPLATGRAYAFMVAIDAAVVIGASQSDVNSGVGTIVPQNVAWPILHDGVVYVAPLVALTGTNTSRVSIQAAYEQ